MRSLSLLYMRITQGTTPEMLDHVLRGSLRGMRRGFFLGDYGRSYRPSKLHLFFCLGWQSFEKNVLEVALSYSVFIYFFLRFISQVSLGAQENNTRLSDWVLCALKNPLCRDEEGWSTLTIPTHRWHPWFWYLGIHRVPELMSFVKQAEKVVD